MAERPLLFLDVDGTVLPFARRHGEPPAGDAELGRRLATLPCTLVWATTWEDEANAVLAPRLGPPPSPVVHWPEPSVEAELENRWFGLHWKTRALAAWAGGRRFAWVDDEITDADVEWAAAHHRDRALLYRVDAFQGVTRRDLGILDTWLRGT